MSTIPTVGINRDHPIYGGGSDPHSVQGGIPSFGSAPQNGLGPQRMGPVGPGESMSTPAPTGGKTMSAAGRDSVATERTRRANTPFAGQPGPVERNYASDGYNPDPMNGVQGDSGPNIAGGIKDMVQGVKSGIQSLGNGISNALNTSVDKRTPAQRQAQSDDSATLANARRDNAKYQ